MILKKFWIRSDELVWEVYCDKDGGLHLGNKVKDSKWNDCEEYVSLDMKIAALEAAQGANPRVASEKIEVKHFVHSEGRFALRVDEDRVYLVAIEGQSPTPSTFLKAFQMMELAHVVFSAVNERAYPYAVEVRSNDKTEFIVHELRNATVFFYPENSRVVINAAGEVEDFGIPVEDVVPILNALHRAGFDLNQSVYLEETDFWLPAGTEWRSPGEESLDGIL